MPLTETEKPGGKGIGKGDTVRGRGGERRRKGKSYFPFLWGWGRVGKTMREFGLLILTCLQDIQVEIPGDRCENGVRQRHNYKRDLHLYLHPASPWGSYCCWENLSETIAGYTVPSCGDNGKCN